MRVLCLGNPHMKGDDLAARLCSRLTEAGFGAELADGMDVDILGGSDGDDSEEVVFVDVVKGLREVRFVSPDELETERTATAHDIDACFYMKMMEKMGRKVNVIGIPYGMDEKKALMEVKKLLPAPARARSEKNPTKRPRGRRSL